MSTAMHEIRGSTGACGNPDLAAPMPLDRIANDRRNLVPSRTSSYDDVQALFLMRLFRLRKLREDLGTRMSDRDPRVKLIEAALRSTLRDCEELGIEGEAHALLE
jgi:hypothetical protein